MRRCYARRAATTYIQWIVVASLIAMALFVGVQLVGNGTNTKMGQTATDLTDPAKLTKRFGS